MRSIVLVGLIAGLAVPWPASAAPPPSLKVSDNGRFLVTVDGQPFFWLGDTAWLMIEKASRVDLSDQPSAVRYFQKRAAQGFNVVQTIVVHVDVPANAAGHVPFVEGDFARPRVLPGPDNDFWDDVDWFVDQAAAHGLYAALLPTWNSSVPEDHPMVKDPAIAYRYGHFLGSRYGARSNIIWVMGGDPPPSRDVGVPERLAMIRAMAEGLADGTNALDRQDGQADWTSTLMTYHPRGGGQSSSKHLHGEPWLDFNMIQTTTRFDFANYETVAADYALQPPKPTLDAEVAYEDSLSLNRKEPQDRRITPWDVRRAAYWSVFAGSFGHTYGHRSFIWWMREGETFKYGAHIPWYESLDAPGANQMRHLRNLIEAHSLVNHVPGSKLLVDKGRGGKAHLQATRSADSRTAVAYSPQGEPVPVRLEKIAASPIVAKWFDPRTGASTPCGTFEPHGIHTFTPPSSGEDQDWVLVLEGE
ncbi:MAG TPA: glycoside hydrolase family 140 protein [Thermoguttaceae bacterium]|nr:glycoside hydrolase family 140 protein [Thermoguttaceae bacterium]